MRQPARGITWLRPLGFQDSRGCSEIRALDHKGKSTEDRSRYSATSPDYSLMGVNPQLLIDCKADAVW